MCTCCFTYSSALACLQRRGTVACLPVDLGTTALGMYSTSLGGLAPCPARCSSLVCSPGRTAAAMRWTASPHCSLLTSSQGRHMAGQIGSTQPMSITCQKLARTALHHIAVEARCSCAHGGACEKCALQHSAKPSKLAHLSLTLLGDQPLAPTSMRPVHHFGTCLQHVCTHVPERSGVGHRA